MYISAQSENLWEEALLVEFRGGFLTSLRELGCLDAPNFVPLGAMRSGRFMPTVQLGVRDAFVSDRCEFVEEAIEQFQPIPSECLYSPRSDASSACVSHVRTREPWQSMSPGLIYEFVREKVGSISAGPKKSAPGYLQAGLGATDLYEWAVADQAEYIDALREYLHSAFRERMQRGDPVHLSAFVVARQRAYFAREAICTPH